MKFMILLVCTTKNLFITELYIDNIQSWTVQFVALENKYELFNFVSLPSYSLTSHLFYRLICRLSLWQFINTMSYWINLLILSLSYVLVNSAYTILHACTRFMAVVCYFCLFSNVGFGNISKYVKVEISCFSCGFATHQPKWVLDTVACKMKRAIELNLHNKDK